MMMTSSFKMAFAGACGFLVLASSSQAAIFYDSMTGVTNFTTTGASPGFLLADGANTIASPGAGQQWQLTSVDFGMFFIGAQTYTAGQLQARINIFGSYNDAGTDPVFQDPLATINYNIGAISSTGNAAFGITGGALAVPVNLPSTLTTMGWTLGFFDTTTGGRIGTVRAAMTTTIAPAVGTSSQGFYRDVNDNGTIEANEKFIFAAGQVDNMIIRFNGTAQPVPEPATLAALGLGAVALIRKRRRK